MLRRCLVLQLLAHAAVSEAAVPTSWWPPTGQMSSDVMFFSDVDWQTFLHNVWQHHSIAANGRYSHWDIDQRGNEQLLKHEENYALLLDGFCTELPLSLLPQASAYVHNHAHYRVSRNGCPLGDPGFVHSKDAVMLGVGLNCPTPTRCVDQQWLKQLAALFASHSLRVRKADLFVPDACGVAYIEALDSPLDAAGRRLVLPYSFYRYGLQLDSFLEHTGLHRIIGLPDETSGIQSMAIRQHKLGRPSVVVLEIGAGWAGFAAITKRMLPNARYIIVDLPVTLTIQMSYLRRLGLTRLVALSASATSHTVQRLLCCEAFEVLFLLPHELQLLPARSVNASVNLDSLVEMDNTTISYYLKQVARVSSSLFTVNQNRGNWAHFRASIGKLTRPDGPFELHEKEQITHPQPLHPLSVHLTLAKRYTEFFLRARV